MSKADLKRQLQDIVKSVYISVYGEGGKKSNNSVEQPQGTCILSHCHNKQISTRKRIYSVTAQTCTISRYHCKAGEVTGLKIEVRNGERERIIIPTAYSLQRQETLINKTCIYSEPPL